MYLRKETNGQFCVDVEFDEKLYNGKHIISPFELRLFDFDQVDWSSALGGRKPPVVLI